MSLKYINRSSAPCHPATGAGSLSDLVTEWQARAANLRRWGAGEPCASAYELAATELQSALCELGDDLLSLREAALVSGYSVDHLGRLIRQGKLANAGRPNAPRVRRGDLPIKASAQLASTTGQRYDPQTDARTLLSRRGER